MPLRLILEPPTADQIAKLKNKVFSFGEAMNAGMQIALGRHAQELLQRLKDSAGGGNVEQASGNMADAVKLEFDLQGDHYDARLFVDATLAPYAGALDRGERENSGSGKMTVPFDSNPRYHTSGPDFRASGARVSDDFQGTFVWVTSGGLEIVARRIAGTRNIENLAVLKTSVQQPKRSWWTKVVRGARGAFLGDMLDAANELRKKWKS